MCAMELAALQESIEVELDPGTLREVRGGPAANLLGPKREVDKAELRERKEREAREADRAK